MKLKNFEEYKINEDLDDKNRNPNIWDKLKKMFKPVVLLVNIAVMFHSPHLKEM